MISFLDLKKQYEQYKSEIDQRVANVFQRGDFIMGQDVRELEELMSEYTGTTAVAISSGTDALLVPLYAMDLNEGDEIITTPFTFFATAEVISFLKLKPIFVDIDPKTCLIDVSKIEAVITPKTKGIISVSLYGQCSDIDEIEKIAQKHNLFHIEDGAQSFGAKYKGQRSCGLASISATSFFPAKPLGTVGDGGMMFFKDAQFAQKCAQILNHGQVERYNHRYIGLNSRFDTLKAAVLLAKFPHYEAELQKREEIASRYTQAFSSTRATILKRAEYTDLHAWAQYSIIVDNRDLFVQKLAQQNIPTAIHYPKPLHLQDAMSYLGLEEGSFPISENISQKIVSLPIHPFLTDDQQKIIIDTVSKTLEEL